MTRRAVDLTGMVFGRLKVIERSPKLGKSTYWYCKCECGNFTTVIAPSLTTGNTKSCGCFRRDAIADRMAQSRATANSNQIREVDDIIASVLAGDALAYWRGLTIDQLAEIGREQP